MPKLFYKNTEDEHVQELRQQRDEYTKKAQEIQHDIDTYILDSWQVPNIIDQWISINYGNDIIVGKVQEIIRLRSGIRINFYFSMHRNENDYISIGTILTATYYLDSSKIPEFKILDEMEAKQLIHQTIDNLFTKI